jgi:hypothetical protein
MIDAAILYGHFVYITANWLNLWPFDTFCGHLVIFSRLGMFYQEQSGNPAEQRSHFVRIFLRCGKKCSLEILCLKDVAFL